MLPLRFLLLVIASVTRGRPITPSWSIEKEFPHRPNDCIIRGTIFHEQKEVNLHVRTHEVAGVIKLTIGRAARQEEFQFKLKARRNLISQPSCEDWLHRISQVIELHADFMLDNRLNLIAMIANQLGGYRSGEECRRPHIMVTEEKVIRQSPFVTAIDCSTSTLTRRDAISNCMMSVRPEKIEDVCRYMYHLSIHLRL